jgi:hypothetical protein
MRVLASVVALALVIAGTATAKTIVGGAGGSLLVGTPRADVILGGPGPDRIFGLAGDDFIRGGGANNRIDAGRGNDRIAVAYGGRDRITCGPGFDTVTADLADSVARDCELASRRISRDLLRHPGGQHESEVEPASFTFGHTTVATFQVGRHFEGAADGIGFAVSRDDGRTWRSGLLPSLTSATAPPGASDRASDPSVTYDAVHRVWLITTLAVSRGETRLTVSRSGDGSSWSVPVTAVDAAPSGGSSDEGGIAFDKEWIACDNGRASPFAGRCYLAYSDVIHGDVVAARFSEDGGLTWSPQVQASQTDAVGVIPVVRPDGQLVLVYLAHESRVEASVSTDGGVSFAAPVVVAPVTAHREPGLRFFPLPSADVDPGGRVWVTWHDCRFASGCAANSAVVSTSPDARSWSTPTAVTSGRDTVLPTIGIDPASGRAAIAYYTVRPAGIDFELVLSRAGSGWDTPRRLSTQTMEATWLPRTASGRMLADYVSVHWSSARPLVVWALASPPVGSSLRQTIYATRG